MIWELKKKKRIGARGDEGVRKAMNKNRPYIGRKHAFSVQVNLLIFHFIKSLSAAAGSPIGQRLLDAEAKADPLIGCL